MSYMAFSPRQVRWVVLVICFVGVASAIPTKAEAQTGLPIPGELLAAYGEKREGKVLPAIQRLQRALSAGSSTAPLSLEEQWMMTEELLYMCRAVADVQCLTTYLDELEAIRQRFPSNEEPGRVVARFHTIFLFRASLAFVTQNAEAMQQILADGILGREQGVGYARVYIDRQLLLARYHLFLGNPEAARLAVDRAFTVVLSFNDVRTWGFWVAQWLSETIELLLATDDVVRAYGVYALSHSFISAMLPHSGPDFVEHTLREMRLLHAVGQLDGAHKAAEKARDTSALLEVTPLKMILLRAPIAIEGTIICVSAGAPDCASRFLAFHPFAQEQLPQELAQLRELPQIEVPIIVLKVMSRLAQKGEEVPAAWVAKLRVAVSAEQVPNEPLREALNALRNLALSLALGKSEPGVAGQAAVAAGRTVLREANRLLSNREATVPLVPLLSKTVLGLTARPVVEVAVQGSERITFALQVIEVLNRNIRHADSDAYVRLATADTEEDRRLLHAASRLAARHTEGELRRLGELMTVAASGEPVSAAAQAHLLDFGIRRYLTDPAKERYAITRKLEEGGRLVLSRLGLPTEEQVRSVLEADEALVATTFAFGHVYHVCIRPDQGAAKVANLDAEQVLRDIRIVVEALTADHAPSAELDSEYPAVAAVRLYEVLVRPVEECIRGARHVVFIPPIDAIGLPLGALLEGIPPRGAHGYDLGAARWFGSRVGVSYVTSVRGFVAARRLALQRWASLGFLGVGDPMLSGYTADGTPREVALTRRSASLNGQTIKTLAELPETSTELKAVASLFGNTHTLLLRENASEARVRREALGQYRILSFATHGLIKNEVHGLTEAALVLTPQSETDLSDDGLLTASEIADLSLNADVVVLSACNTARYDLGQFGVEVQGMATAFAIAGVPRIVATLWPVESALAERMITRLFTDLQTRQRWDVAEALRLARSQAISDARGTPYAHPRFWAAFTLFGDGRGTQAIVKPPANPRLVLRGTGLLAPKKVGEVVTATLIPGAKDLLLAGFADPISDVYQRTVVRLDVNGREQWTFQDRAGAGDIVSSENSAYSSGFSLENQEFHPLVTKLRLDGTAEWTRVLRIGRMKSPGSRLVLLPTGQVIAVLFAYRPMAELGPGAKGDERKLIFVELTDDGVEVRRAQIDLGSGIMSTRIRTVVVGDRLMIVTSDHGAFSQGPREWDMYDDFRSCQEASTIIRIVDLKSFSLEATSEHAGLDVAAILATADGRVLGAGSLNRNCTSASLSKLIIAELQQDAGLRLMFTEEDSYRSRGAGLFSGPNGTYFVVGQSDRVFGTQRYSTDEITKTRIEDYARRRDRTQLMDGLILQFDLQGTIINRAVVSGGASFWLTGGAYVDGRIFAAGSVGFEWGWVEYELK